MLLAVLDQSATVESRLGLRFEFLDDCTLDHIYLELFLVHFPLI